jgi:hypothetical protein
MLKYTVMDYFTIPGLNFHGEIKGILKYISPCDDFQMVTFRLQSRNFQLKDESFQFWFCPVTLSFKYLYTYSHFILRYFAQSISCPILFYINSLSFLDYFIYFIMEEKGGHTLISVHKAVTFLHKKCKWSSIFMPKIKYLTIIDIQWCENYKLLPWSKLPGMKFYIWELNLTSKISPNILFHNDTI